MNKIDNMTDHELLVELVRAKRRQGFWRGVRIVFVLLLIAAIVTLCYLYMPKILTPIREYQQTMADLQSSIDRFNSSLDKFDSMSADAKTQIDQMTTQAQDLLDQINALGLDKLQENVQKLEEAMGKMSSFFRIGS